MNPDFVLTVFIRLSKEYAVFATCGDIYRANQINPCNHLRWPVASMPHLAPSAISTRPSAARASSTWPSCSLARPMWRLVALGPSSRRSSMVQSHDHVEQGARYSPRGASGPHTTLKKVYLKLSYCSLSSRLTKLLQDPRRTRDEVVYIIRVTCSKSIWQWLNEHFCCKKKVFTGTLYPS